MKRLLIGALLLLLPLASCRTGRPRTPIRVLITEGPAWGNVPDLQRAGLRLLMEDLAECGGATILLAPPVEGLPGILRISLEGSREGTRLQFHARILTQEGRERDVVPTSSNPCTQLHQILSAAGLASPATRAILPQDPARLPLLAEAYGGAISGDDAQARSAGDAAQTLAALEPECATAVLASAESTYRRLLTQAPANLEAQAVAAQGFETVLALLPGFPRGSAEAGRFFTDTGNQRRAMEVLFGALAQHPRSTRMRNSLAYAARTTGLLQGARATLHLRDQLEGGSGPRDRFPETTYLYLGDWARFDANLGPGPSEKPDPMGDFYRGYLRLLQGRREEALANFEAARRPQPSDPQFQTLAAAYALCMEGRRAESLLTLRNLARTRADLRVPDGEFTFKIAEAFGFAGAPDEAMDMAQEAFSEGFGCTPWFERTPLLASLHDLPRWRALVEHLRDRQRLLESRFPAQAFEALR